MTKWFQRKGTMPNTSYPDDPTDILRDVLKLERVAADEDSSTFRGYTPTQTRGRVFGGQVMAQSLVAASHSVEADRFLHSMHCYFIRPGDASQPLNIRVDHNRDGRSFSVRHVEVTQHHKVILSLTCSFQTEAAGVEHQEPMPQGIPLPDDLRPESSLAGMIHHPEAQDLAYNRTFDIRYASDTTFLRPRPWHTDPTTPCWNPSCAIMGSPGLSPRNRSPHWITPCGSTGRSTWTTGCCLSKSRRLHSRHAGSGSAGSIRFKAIWSPRWRRK